MAWLGFNPRWACAMAVGVLASAALVASSRAQGRPKPVPPAPPAPAAASAEPLAPASASASVLPPPLPGPPAVAPVQAPPAAQAAAPARADPEPRAALASIGVGANAPDAAPRAPSPLPSERSDHAKVVGRFGVSWLGVSELPLAVAVPTGTAASPGLSPNDRVVTRQVSAPTLGLRYWVRDFIAIEPGIGFSYSGGGTRSELGGASSEVDKQTTTAMMLHLGAPIALATGKHIALVAIPEINVGFARSSVRSYLGAPNAPPDAELHGFRFDAGARAGAEIHFGFMGLPELALEGSIGLLYTRQSASASVANQKVSDTVTLLTTSTFSNPWDIFKGAGTIAARYYF